MNTKEERRSAPSSIYIPDVDIREDGEAIMLTVDIPGATQEHVELMIENGILTLDAKPDFTAPSGYSLAGQEWGYGSFHRTFQLPESIRTEQISAHVRQGVLTIQIPKREEVKTRRIEIEK